MPYFHDNCSQITLRGPVMTQVQRGEKTNIRGDLDTEVIRTFDKEVNTTDKLFLWPHT